MRWLGGLLALFLLASPVAAAEITLTLPDGDLRHAVHRAWALYRCPPDTLERQAAWLVDVTLQRVSLGQCTGIKHLSGTLTVTVDEAAP